MAYVKQTWQTGEVITADKLNHMEDGIGSCVMVVGVTVEGQTATLDKTWQEIHDALDEGKVVLINNSIKEIVIGATKKATETGFEYSVLSLSAEEDEGIMIAGIDQYTCTDASESPQHFGIK